MKKVYSETNHIFGWSGPAAGAAIFRIIKESGPLSRSQIVHKTGLSKSTVSIYVDKLIQLGLVIESANQIQHFGVGRKGQLLQFAINNGYIIGIELGATSLDVALCNLDAEILDYRTKEILVSLGPDLVMKEVSSIINQLLMEHNLAKTDLFGIGMGVPGPVEFAIGEPVSPPIMPGWDRYPIRKVLQEQYQCPAFIDNDVNVMAIGEKHNGLGKNVENFIFIKVGTGIGAGIVCHNKLYRGAQGCAGDIGHIALDGVETFCPCGNQGCLEIVAAGPAIGKLGEAAAKKGQSEMLLERLNQQGYITAKDVGLLAKHGDPVCVNIIRESGRSIGQVLAKLINFFNPSMVIIGGGVANLGDRFIAAIKEVVYQRSLPLATRELQITYSGLNGKSGMVGAAAMVIEEIFSHNNVTEMVSTEKRKLRHLRC